MLGNTLVLYSSVDSHGKHDASGAFAPEARRFAKVHDIPDELVIGMPLAGVPRQVRKRRTLEAIHDAGSAQPLEGLMMFGHGWPNGIQFGFLRQDIPDLANLLARKAFGNLRICLYACLTAENDVRDSDHEHVGAGTDGGFADMLRDQLVRVGVDWGWVDAHKPAGHTTKNHYVVRFRGDAVEDSAKGGLGGRWIVEPGSDLWPEWKRRYHDPDDDLRFRVPFLNESEILTELEVR